jgi:hypothetical protein
VTSFDADFDWQRGLILWAGRKPGTAKRNHDHSSDFAAYRIDALPPEFLVARMRAADVTDAA